MVKLWLVHVHSMGIVFHAAGDMLMLMWACDHSIQVLWKAITKWLDELRRQAADMFMAVLA